MEGTELAKPTARHVLTPGHETLESESSPAGAIWGFQDVPSVVFRIEELPTAVHSEAVMQAIDWLLKES